MIVLLTIIMMTMMSKLMLVLLLMMMTKRMKMNMAVLMMMMMTSGSDSRGLSASPQAKRFGSSFSDVDTCQRSALPRTHTGRCTRPHSPGRRN